MGIDIEWKMVQGATLRDWEKALEGHPDLEGWEEDFAEFLLSEVDLYSISPWYDAGSDECAYGILLDKGDGLTEIDLPSLVERAEEARKELKERYGIETSTICSQHVW